MCVTGTDVVDVSDDTKPLQVNTHALDSQQVYPEHISFDGWDALYNSYTYYRSSLNDHLSKNFDINVAVQAVGQLDWQELIKDPNERYINHFYTGLVVPKV